MKCKIGGITLVLAGIILGAVLVLKARSQVPVTVTLRIEVTPQQQSDFVSGQAKSARFKYLVGKKSGVKPVLAQKLSIKPVPNLSLLEAKVGVQTKDEGQRYANAFVETLQVLCGKQTQLTLSTQTIR